VAGVAKQTAQTGLKWLPHQPTNIYLGTYFCIKWVRRLVLKMRKARPSEVAQTFNPSYLTEIMIVARR
jgi:hypothetical protein